MWCASANERSWQSRGRWDSGCWLSRGRVTGFGGTGSYSGNSGFGNTGTGNSGFYNSGPDNSGFVNSGSVGYNSGWGNSSSAATMPAFQLRGRRR